MNCIMKKYFNQIFTYGKKKEIGYPEQFKILNCDIILMYIYVLKFEAYTCSTLCIQLYPIYASWNKWTGLCMLHNK